MNERPLLSPLVRTAACAAFVVAAAGLAQAAPHHPFAVGASEGAVGHQSGLGAWLLAQESTFYRLLTDAVRTVGTTATGAASLIALSFGYGVFHAAGPGHGKAVIAAYMVSNEVALRRGLVIAALAALLQGAVAVALVGTAALVFHATAQRMTGAAAALELASYLGIVALGVILVWRKGRALAAALRPTPFLAFAGLEGPLAFARPSSGRFAADDGASAHIHGPDCGHVHMPDPQTLEAVRFDWRAAFLTVLTAGARPCSGAILVLVFALAQGVFPAGIASAFAMAAGTAITTGALAGVAVFAKGLALRLATGRGRHAAIAGRLVEFAAAVGVLAAGGLLLAAALGRAASAG